tara:strand:- start:196 stop:774 length:579 start_codon:yes stop_codon:yes gene_type:complete
METISMHMLSVESGVPLKLLRSGKFSSEQWRDLAASSGFLAESSIHVVSKKEITAQEINSCCNKLAQKEENLKLVIIDGFEQINRYGDPSKREEEISETLGALTCMARELSVAVVLTVSLPSRHSPPTIKDLEAYSESINKCADTVFFLHGNESTFELYVARHQGWQGNLMCPLLRNVCGKFMPYPADGLWF